MDRAAAMAIRQAITISPSLMPDDLAGALAVWAAGLVDKWCADGCEAVVGPPWLAGLAEAAAPEGLGPGVWWEIGRASCRERVCAIV